MLPRSSQPAANDSRFPFAMTIRYRMDEPPYGGVWRKIQMNAQMCSVQPGAEQLHPHASLGHDVAGAGLQPHAVTHGTPRTRSPSSERFPLASFVFLACLFGWSPFLFTFLTGGSGAENFPLGPVLATLVVVSCRGGTSCARGVAGMQELACGASVVRTCAARPGDDVAGADRACEPRRWGAPCRRGTSSPTGRRRWSSSSPC